jgi:CheY-like chemotaxis protein
MVDDLTDEIEIFAAQLEKAGHQVTKEPDLDNALKELKSGQYQLLILDIMMPAGRYQGAPGNEEGMTTGLEFLKELRKDLPSLPVIVLTNVSRSEVLKQLHGIPSTRMVQKASVSYPLDALPRLAERFVRTCRPF